MAREPIILRLRYGAFDERAYAARKSSHQAQVRTGGPGIGGVSLLLIERDMPGVTVRRMKTQGYALALAVWSPRIRYQSTRLILMQVVDLKHCVCSLRRGASADQKPDWKGK